MECLFLQLGHQQRYTKHVHHAIIQSWLMNSLCFLTAGRGIVEWTPYLLPLLKLVRIWDCNYWCYQRVSVLFLTFLSCLKHSHLIVILGVNCQGLSHSCVYLPQQRLDTVQTAFFQNRLCSSKLQFLLGRFSN